MHVCRICSEEPEATRSVPNHEVQRYIRSASNSTLPEESRVSVFVSSLVEEFYLKKTKKTLQTIDLANWTDSVLHSFLIMLAKGDITVKSFIF